MGKFVSVVDCIIQEKNVKAHKQEKHDQVKSDSLIPVPDVQKINPESVRRARTAQVSKSSSPITYAKSLFERKMELREKNENSSLDAQVERLKVIIQETKPSIESASAIIVAFAVTNFDKNYVANELHTRFKIPKNFLTEYEQMEPQPFTQFSEKGKKINGVVVHTPLALEEAIKHLSPTAIIVGTESFKKTKDCPNAIHIAIDVITRIKSALWSKSFDHVNNVDLIYNRVGANTYVKKFFDSHFGKNQEKEKKEIRSSIKTQYPK